MYLRHGKTPRRSILGQFEKGIAELLFFGDDRPDLEVIATESDVAAEARTRSEAEGVEGHLQLRRHSNQHAREVLHVTVPSEFDPNRHESLENNAKANVGKTCYVNVKEAIRQPSARFLCNSFISSKMVMLFVT